MECYYDDTGECYGDLWICRTCHQWFCEKHNHTTDKGTNVECAACEYNRRDYERDYPNAETETRSP